MFFVQVHSSCAVVGDSRDPTVAARSSLDKVVDMPVVCNDRCPWSMTSRSSSTVVNVPVITQRRLYSGSTSDSVHRQSHGHPVVQQRMVLDLAVMAAMKGRGAFRRY